MPSSSSGSYSLLARLSMPVRGEDAGDVSVLVRCHDHVLAVSTRYIERLLLPEEIAKVELISDPSGDKSEKGRRAVALIHGQYYAAWDLGQMMELPSLANAWMLLRLPRGESEVALALRTGPCLAVHPVYKPVPIPPGLFKARRGAFIAAFDGAQIGPSEGVLVGLCLEPSALWSEAELSASVTAIGLARSRGPIPEAADRPVRGEVARNG